MKKKEIEPRAEAFSSQICQCDVIFSCCARCRYCSTVTPPVLTSTENVMQVRFVSDASVGNEGFSASYVALNASTSKFLSFVKMIQEMQ